MFHWLRVTPGVALLLVPLAAQAQFPSLPKLPFEKTEAIGTTEGLRKGLEDVVRAASQSQSQAPTSPLIDRETARGMSLDNQVKATNTFFQKRQLNRMYRDAERGERNTQADFNNWARDEAPDRLNGSQFDSYSGEIQWPGVLRTEKYQVQRTKMEALYSSHTQAGGGINTVEYAQIQKLSKDMQMKLRSNLKEVTPEQYTSARKFLESLRYEARHPTGN